MFRNLENVKVYLSFILCVFSLFCYQKVVAQDTSIVSYAIFDDPEVMARFPRGEDSLLAFISRNLSYPRTHVCFEGVVYVEFEVDEQGIVSKPRIIKGLGNGIDKEVLKLIKLMPKWKPALNNKLPVKSSFILPVGFEL